MHRVSIHVLKSWRIMIKPQDLSTIGGRIGHVAHLIGGASELARRVDTSHSTISRIIQGRETTVSIMIRVYQALKPAGVTLEWLLLGEGDSDVMVPVTHNSGSSVVLKVYSEHESSKVAPIYFDLDWFRASVSQSPERCYAFRALEDELKGIRKGAWTVTDTSVLFGDGLYLIGMAGTTSIRQLQFLPTEEIVIKGNSDSFQDFTLSPTQKGLIKIIGRLVWWETH